ncbi:MAG TPA: imidazole glycerol phosphate synthase subunit HisH [Oscillospiraceae bacterium]|nr:imidazole glycerol phosphate synthase subunit HisH [Oscillospiraceae bacterium]
MIAIIDYGAGNIFSVKNALDYIGLPNILTNKKEDLINADGLILPGVGAFPSAMKMLKETELIDTIKEQSKLKPFLGICLGMQLIFSKGYEFEECEGLGLIEGTVELMEEPNLSIPHIGWNKLEVQNECPLLNGLSKDEYVYFVHSYKAHCADENISAFCEYGHKVPALVFKENIYGAQFHPEKSGDVGLQILKNFGGLL